MNEGSCGRPGLAPVCPSSPRTESAVRFLLPCAPHPAISVETPAPRLSSGLLRIFNPIEVDGLEVTYRRAFG